VHGVHARAPNQSKNRQDVGGRRGLAPVARWGASPDEQPPSLIFGSAAGADLLHSKNLEIARPWIARRLLPEDNSGKRRGRQSLAAY